MKFRKRDVVIISIGLFFLFLVCKGLYSVFFSIEDAKLDSEGKVLKYLKSQYKGESFVINVKNVEEMDTKSCGRYDKYTWTVKSTNTDIEFIVTSGYDYKGNFACQKYNTNDYMIKAINKYAANVDENKIKIGTVGYYDISFTQKEISDSEFVEGVYNIILDLKKEYPFKNSNIGVQISMNNGTKKFLKIKDIDSLSYLKSKLSI